MPAVGDGAAAAVAAWAKSGAMALTGHPDGPFLGPPAPLVIGLDHVGEVIRSRSRQLGCEVVVDPLHELVQRASFAGLTRRGRISCGGATRLLRGADGWVALCLARAEDVELLAALLEAEPTTGDTWTWVEEEFRSRAVGALRARALLLGLPFGVLPDVVAPDPQQAEQSRPSAVTAHRLGDASPVQRMSDVVVVDLSGLWAGPLCSRLLTLAGARVVKVESVRRPDGARRGSQGFFDYLNGAKSCVAFDFGAAGDVERLTQLIRRADVVIESSRPRALEQLGIVARREVGWGGPRMWVSITGYGRTGAGANAVAFGDDAAVSAGLVAWDHDGPVFCADAIADPVSGLAAAAAVLSGLALGGRWLIDVSMVGVAASVAGPTLPSLGAEPQLAPPPAPESVPAGDLGAHTEAVLAELSVSR